MIAGLNKLVNKGLIGVDRKRIILLDPPTLDYWEDRKQKVAKLVVEAAPVPVLTEDWVEVLVDCHYQTSWSDRDCLVQMIKKQVSPMKKANICIADIHDYSVVSLKNSTINEQKNTISKSLNLLDAGHLPSGSYRGG